ncbi:hypothetical protein FBU30_006207 [Linnemannia zychae]|nr:hypothetical protein FBU30_006207 [Linnemannia zychae]
MARLPPPEVIYLIPGLSTRDMLNCCLVNKAWNATFTPLIWYCIQPPQKIQYSSLDRQLIFWSKIHDLIADDIIYRRQTPPNNDNVGLQPALSRNGQWIHTLVIDREFHQGLVWQKKVPSILVENSPISTKEAYQSRQSSGVRRLFHIFKQQKSSSSQQRPAALDPVRFETTHYRGVTQLEFYLHLFRQCPNLQFLKLKVNICGFYSGFLTVRFPESVKVLDLDIYLYPDVITGKPLPFVFPGCPPQIQKLCVNIDYNVSSIREKDDDAYNDIEVNPDAMEIGELPDLRELHVRGYYGDKEMVSCIPFLDRCVNLESLHLHVFPPVWAKALESCIHLRRLVVFQIESESIQVFAETLATSLPHLDSFEISPLYEYSSLAPRMRELVPMLSACRAGWRSIKLPTLDNLCADELVRHCATLEELDVRQVDNLDRQQLVQILSKSPKLKIFSMLDSDSNKVIDRGHIPAADFIDLDDSTKEPKPWACESTLKVFRARISSIPRPGLTSKVKENYPGESFDLQKSVYKRLASFRRMERLELGNRGPDNHYTSGEFISGGETDVMGNQTDCLEMTLASGLGALEGLKELKELSVMRMACPITVVDAQWMVKSWPRLEAFRGLEPPEKWFNRGSEPVWQWLFRNYPHIRQQPTERLGSTAGS